MADLPIVDKSLRSVFVGNIPYEATEEKLKEIFSQVGQVLSFKLVYDRESGKPKGYGFCEYQDQETALSAMRNLNGFEIGGRTLRVDNACTEKSRLELQDILSGPSSEPQYGDEVDTDKAPEAISKAVASLPPEQMFELMKQMKLCIQNNPSEARAMLLQNPQLAYALLQAQVIMRIVDPNTALSMLQKAHKITPLMPEAPRVEQTVNRSMDSESLLSGLGFSKPVQLGDSNPPRPSASINLPGLSSPEGSNPPRSDFNSDPFKMPGAGGMMGGPPGGGMRPPFLGGNDGPARPFDRAPEPDFRGMGRGGMDDRPRGPDDFNRGPPMPFQGPGGPGPRGPPGPPGGPSGPPNDFDKFGRGAQPEPYAPPRPRGDMDGRRDFGGPGGPDRGGVFDRDPRGRGGPGGPLPSGPSIERDPRQSPGQGGRPQPPPPASAVGAAAVGAAAAGAAGGGGEQDSEKAALIMQVLQLSDDQISMLPPEQRQSILMLKNQIARSNQN